MLTTQERIALIEYAALTLADDLNRALGLPYHDSTMAAHNQWIYFLTMPVNESLDNKKRIAYDRYISNKA